MRRIAANQAAVQAQGTQQLDEPLPLQVIMVQDNDVEWCQDQLPCVFPILTLGERSACTLAMQASYLRAEMTSGISENPVPKYLSWPK